MPLLFTDHLLRFLNDFTPEEIPTSPSQILQEDLIAADANLGSFRASVRQEAAHARSIFTGHVIVRAFKKPTITVNPLSTGEKYIEMQAILGLNNWYYHQVVGTCSDAISYRIKADNKTLEGVTRLNSSGLFYTNLHGGWRRTLPLPKSYHNDVILGPTIPANDVEIINGVLGADQVQISLSMHGTHTDALNLEASNPGSTSKLLEAWSVDHNGNETRIQSTSATLFDLRCGERFKLRFKDPNISGNPPQRSARVALSYKGPGSIYDSYVIEYRTETNPG